MKYLGETIDFRTPVGEPALSDPNSVAWRLFKNPVTLFIGGVAAVILELAEPRVRTGVWDQSTFRRNPVARMRRTGLAAMVTVYGPQSQSKRMIGKVARMHDRVTGVTPCGTPFRANDEELLTWVQATASFGFLEAYCAYAEALPFSEKNRFYDEQTKAAPLYGATRAPRSEKARQDLFSDMQSMLEPSDILLEFLSIVRNAPALPQPLTRLQRPLVRAAVDLLGPELRVRLGLGPMWSPRKYEGAAIRAAARLAERTPIPGAPPAQACQRLGLPWSWLYSSEAQPRFAA
ncbi:MAG: oxygenase MpaB family protein [Pseudomonadota bacterium]